ncbi:MAG: DUF47 family protein [Candidatus Micrarchaeota archaeon]|nr:DUF47 family protein [Candidatus Micrarchaeota archaeon]MDE1804446.1 DUF47 family protein [Candidatus Micrarchaeota archaeon]MDE1847074.1 DUF47 family protein [Candidatus Micrarchaeota archaeon]
MSIIDKLFKSHEEDVIKFDVDLIGIAIKANKELYKMVSSGSDDLGDIHRLEQQADEKVQEIRNMISSGAIAPNILDDMFMLVDFEDNIIDSIYNLAREYSRYKLPSLKMRTMVQIKMLKSIEMVGEALDSLYKMESSEDLSRMRNLRAKIEKLEEREDNIKDSLLDYVYDNKVDFKSFYHIVELAHKADNIMDAAEDTADMFLSIMVSIMT